MKRTKWGKWFLLGGAALGLALAMTPMRAAADDASAVVAPAVQTFDDSQAGTPIQLVGWRRGWVGPGVTVYGGPAVGVYVGPRYYPQPYYYGPPRYYAPRYSSYYQPYPVYRYSYSPYATYW